MKTDNNSQEFNKALSNFVSDFAEGNRIRILASKGCTVDEIRAKLDFPLGLSTIASIVFEHCIKEGLISLEDPKPGSFRIQAEYVQDTDSLGRKSLRRVEKKIEVPQQIFYPVNFGILKYQSSDKFKQALAEYTPRVKEHFALLPWPMQTVYISEKLFELINHV